MKNKNKNKLKYLSLGILLTGALGFSTLAVKQTQVKAESENVVNINRENKKLVSYDDVNNEISFTVTEINNYTWHNLANLFNEHNNNSYYSVSTITYDGDVYHFDSIETDSQITYVHNAMSIILFLDGDDKFILDNDGADAEFDSDFVLYFFDDYYDEVKQAIELDIQANETSMSEQIIETIGSGLGLIGNLATEFLTGFTTLFYNTTTQQLTDFAVFSLVMLGVAVSFAVIKLVLAIVRSNTGA